MTEDFDKARANYEHALAIHEKTLGPDHPTVAYPLTHIGLVLRFHIRLFPLIAKRYDRMLKESEKTAQLENQESSAK